jgi:hypothetical protein
MQSPEEIARQIDADLAAREEKELATLRRVVAPGFSEVIVSGLVVAFAVGAFGTAAWCLPTEHEGLYRLMLLWIGGFIIASSGAILWLHRRFRATRRFLVILERRFDRLERRVRT